MAKTALVTGAARGQGRAEAAQYATVQKQLERLEGKGFVRRDRTLFVHVFAASTKSVARTAWMLRRIQRKCR